MLHANFSDHESVNICLEAWSNDIRIGWKLVSSHILAQTPPRSLRRDSKKILGWPTECPVQCGFDRTWIQNVTCIPHSNTYLLRHAFAWKGLLAAFWHVLEISSPHGREGCVPATRAMLWCNEVSVRRHRHTLVTYRQFNIRILCLSGLADSLGVIVI